jgi:hypothetical protein
VDPVPYNNSTDGAGTGANFCIIANAAATATRLAETAEAEDQDVEDDSIDASNIAGNIIIRLKDYSLKGPTYKYACTRLRLNYKDL